MHKNRRFGGKLVLALTLVFVLTVSMFLNAFAFSVNVAADGNVGIVPASVVPGSTFTDFTQPAQLQRQAMVPDLLVMWDGTAVTTPEQWEERRQEIRRLLEFYFYGPVRITPNYVEYSSHTVTPGAGGVQNINITVVGGPDAQNFATGVSTTGVTATTGNIGITVPAGTPPEGGWPLILGGPHSAAFWHARGFATAGQPAARGAHDALFGPRLNTVWYRNTGAYGIAAWMTQMLINGLRAEADGLNRLNINPDRVAVSGASTGGKRAAAIGAMAECVWLSIPGAGGTGAANMYRQNSGNTTWNMFSGPSTLAGAPGSFGGLNGGSSGDGVWGPIGLAECWGGHAGWDGNYGGHYRNIPHNMNRDFSPLDIHFVAAMYARADGGKFFMPATGISMESTNGVPGIQQMIDHSLPAFRLAGVPNNLGARVTRSAHGVDLEATAVILATINYVEGRHTPNNGYPDMARYFTNWTGASPFSQAVQDYIYGLNFNISHMHITPFASPENAEMFARIQPCCNGDCDPCDCPEWCPQTEDGLCCDPGVPPIDHELDLVCIVIDFVGEDDDENALRMGRQRQSLGWNQGANVGVLNAEGLLQRAFTNWGGGIIFNLPLGEAKLGNFDQLQVDVLISASSGGAFDGNMVALFTQTRDPFPPSGNWMDGVGISTRMARPFQGVGVMGSYVYDLTTPFLDENGNPLPEGTRGITNYARWMTGDVSIAIGRNVNTQTFQFSRVWLRAIGCVCHVCTDWHDVYFEVAEGQGTLTATVDGEAIESGDKAIAGYDVIFTARPVTSPVRYMVSQWLVNGEVYEVDGEVFTGNVLVHELAGDVEVEVYFVVSSEPFSLHAFNNGTINNPSLAGGGTIRIWTRLDNANALIPHEALTVTAIFPDEECAMGLVNVNRPWNNQAYVNFIDVNMHAPWQRIYLTATWQGQVVELTLINPRFLSLEVFNNGEGGSPSTPNASLAEVGLIRIWTRLMGVEAPISGAAVAVAADQDNACALYLFTFHRTEAGTIRTIDVNKNAAWEYINFSITVYGQTIELLLVNDLFVAPHFPVLSFDIFNNGEGGSPSRPNPGLAAAGTIRMWTQLDGVNAPLYLAAAGTIIALDQDNNCAYHLLTVNRVWQAGEGFLPYVNRIDVNKNAPWQYINFSIVAHGRTVELLLVNDNFVPATVYHTVTFTIGAGAPGVYAAPGQVVEIEVPAGQAIPAGSVPSTVARAGFYFAGWYPADPAAHGNVYGDVAFMATFNLLFHYVTFEAGEGGVLLPQGPPLRLRDGWIISTVPQPEALPGYVFVGWVVAGEDVAAEPVGFVVRDNVTFRAVFAVEE